MKAYCRSAFGCWRTSQPIFCRTKNKRPGTTHNRRRTCIPTPLTSTFAHHVRQGVVVMTVRGWMAVLAIAGLAAACGGGNTPPSGGETAPGVDRTAKTAALETGANLMQDKAP